ncbi:16S rRNA (guanine(966)-N(2))-methyltransferase RsmD [[Acholeplasma] multilocale]|uniref:16S rRNA (guanine(966)-N(2))-methyltransferase RsmD n=1 Tax=[Acholeplasma] multilocale TaxID=264638 RepID=UPI000478F929|nr:16S rRNA (guanine(966)-N(2))-methyltransferase RsmD [[Acholeplasma] multilocale]
MIVISGKYRGRRLYALEGDNTRPTTARMKEDMFNILNNYFIFDGKKSLDLFGGSGALSIEGLSRGIEHAYINDNSRYAMSVIKENLKGIHPSNFTLYEKDYSDLLDLFNIKDSKFDLFYLDPPFKEVEYYYNFFNKVVDYNLANNWAIVIVESEKALDLEQIKEFKLLKHKEYKTKNMYFFRLERG